MTSTPRWGTSANLIVLLMLGEQRLGGVEPDLLGVDVEGGDELDVTDVVAAEDDVHETGDPVGRIGVLVVGEPLHQRAGAVAHAGDGEPDSGHVCSSMDCLDRVRSVSIRRSSQARSLARWSASRSSSAPR